MKACVLWTGGKDSCLALHRALDQGISVASLVTFVPADGRDFKAHPRRIIEQQARAMQIPHIFVPIIEPYEKSYEEKLALLRDMINVEGMISGDIDHVTNLPNWMEQRCLKVGVDMIRPLWKNNRNVLMNEILNRQIEAQITWINDTNIPMSWKGRIIDRCLLEELKRISETKGIDLCGENGEYHTMVARAPIFGDRRIEISTLLSS